MMVRGGGDPRQAWLARRLREWACRLGALPPMRMTASWFGSVWNPPNTSVWRDHRAHGELPSDHHPDTYQPDQKSEWLPERPASLSIVPPRAQASRRCETQAALGRQSRPSSLAFRSLDAFRALREPDRRRRDEERPFPLRTKNWPQAQIEQQSRSAAEKLPAIDPPAAVDAID